MMISVKCVGFCLARFEVSSEQTVEVVGGVRQRPVLLVLPHINTDSDPVSPPVLTDTAQCRPQSMRSSAQHSHDGAGSSPVLPYHIFNTGLVRPGQAI